MLHPAAQGRRSTTSAPPSTASRRRALTEALEALSNGRVVSQIVDGNRRFDVVMRLSDDDRSTTGLAGPAGRDAAGRVPLRLLAEVDETDGPNQILRENGQRRIVVLGQQRRQRDMAAIVADIRRDHRRDAAAAGLHHAAGRHVPGAGGGRTASSRCCRWCRWR